jgi:hypothetical protein
VLCSWESPFANCLAGAPGGDYLSRAIVDRGGAPTADTAFMGLTSCRRVTIAGTLTHRRRECAIGIMPTAVSLSNATPTATPSSVMGPYSAGKIHRANFLTQDSGLLRQTGGVVPL